MLECARTAGNAASRFKSAHQFMKSTLPSTREDNHSSRFSNRIEKYVPTPINTRNPVQNFPKSRMAFPPLSTKSSGFAHRPQIQFGKGARTYVKTTRRGRYCFQSAQDRITRRKPTASTWLMPSLACIYCTEHQRQVLTSDKAIMVLRPAGMVDKVAKRFEGATLDVRSVDSPRFR